MPASILASIQTGETQWTQAPDRDTDTLPASLDMALYTLHT